MFNSPVNFASIKGGWGPAGIRDPELEQSFDPIIVRRASLADRHAALKLALKQRNVNHFARSMFDASTRLLR